MHMSSVKVPDVQIVISRNEDASRIHPVGGISINSAGSIPLGLSLSSSDWCPRHGTASRKLPGEFSFDLTDLADHVYRGVVNYWSGGVG